MMNCEFGTYFDNRNEIGIHIFVFNKNSSLLKRNREYI